MVPGTGRILESCHWYAYACIHTRIYTNINHANTNIYIYWIDINHNTTDHSHQITGGFPSEGAISAVFWKFSLLYVWTNRRVIWDVKTLMWQIELVAMELKCTYRLPCPVRIFCCGVSGFMKGCPWGVWCLRLTTCTLHVGPIFGNSVQNKFVCNVNIMWNIFSSCIHIYR